MPDVFISYARQDRERARVLAGALETRGWSVWWDRKIIAGQTFDQTIEQQLESARSVVVLWSEHSIGSEWVRNEAAVASERDAFVPARIDNVRVPLEFRRRQAADLTRWTGDLADPEFHRLCEGIEAKTRVAALPPETRPDVHRDWPMLRAIAAIVAGTAIASLGVYGIWRVVTRDGGRVDRLQVVDAARPDTSVDDPLPLAPGTVHKIGLGPNQEYYLRLSESLGDVKIVLDMRRIDNRPSNLQSRLDMLDQNGAVLQERVIDFNEVDVGARKTATRPARRPSPIGFKLLNGDSPADFWLSVRPEPAPQFVPLFGSVVPKPLPVGDAASGLLNENEDTYFMVSLRQGTYQVTADFTNAERRNTNILGSIALLEGDGGNSRKIAQFNEVDVSSRKVETFLVRNDGPAILNVENTGDTVRYTLKLAEAELDGQAGDGTAGTR
jgi:hypothetical protein